MALFSDQVCYFIAFLSNWFVLFHSGPKRYDYVDGQWVYKHDGQTLIDLLKSELEQTFNISVDLSL